MRVDISVSLDSLILVDISKEKLIALLILHHNEARSGELFEPCLERIILVKKEASWRVVA